MRSETRTAGSGGGAPLSGCRVLELSTHVSGAYCGLLLRLMGAEVVRWDAPLAVDCPAERLAEAMASLNAGKQTASVDELSARYSDFDLVVFDSLDEDAFDGAWSRASNGLAESLDPSTPRVDIGGIRTGKDRGDWLPASTLTVSAFAGMSWAIGAEGLAPLSLPYDIPGYLTGAEAAGAACLALLSAQFGGAPASWDVSEADVVASCVGQISSNFVHYGRPWARDGARASESGGFYPAAMFRCRDGFVSLFCRTNREWANLRRAMGDPKWSRQPGFEDGRVVARFHANEADVHLKAWAERQTCAQIDGLAKEFGFPIARILSVNEACQLEHFALRGLVSQTSDQRGGPRLVGPPWDVQTGPVPPPQHTVPSPTSDPTLTSPECPRQLELRPTSDAPLAGLKVLDLSWVWSGPMVTAALADLGADVIKVEGVRRPDPSRLRGAAIRDGVPVPGPDLEVSPYFNQMNRGKRSIGIDITTDRGAELVRSLAAVSDVVVENMRPGALDRRGLGYADLRKLNPGLVMLSMSMMGQTGPLREVGGYAPVMSGLTGLDSLVGYSREELIGLYNPALGDPNGAAHGLALLLAVLRQRAVTGCGAWLDLAQVECLLSILRVPVLLADQVSPVPPPANEHGSFDPHGVFSASGEDAWVAVAARTEAERNSLATVIGYEATDQTGFAAALASWCKAYSPEEAARLLSASGVSAAAVNGIEAVEAAGWSKARELHRPTVHPYLGEQLIYGLTWKRQGLGYVSSSRSPLLGEHTSSILAQELGMDQGDVDELVSAGVLTLQGL